jgi:UPF0176 protein
MSDQVKILLYYKYVPINNPHELRLAQRALCEQLGIFGRILLSSEGINGTVAGSAESIDEYMATVEKYPEFADIEWKISYAEEQVFPKLRIVVRDEIVTLGVAKSGADVSLENKADYIEPSELLEKYEKGEEFVIIDARNQYEASIGKFKDSIIPDITNFRDFPAFAKTLEEYKDKEVITYCTGGVRCEKASAYLRENGFNKVRQLHGGVHEYGVKAGGKYFEGEMFVFDKRLHVPVNSENPSVISKCQFCNTAVARYIDCAIISCNSLFICCESCQEARHGACGDECEEQVLALASEAV